MFGISTTIIELFLLNALMAYSAYIVLTGGSFSFAYVAFIGVGAYATGIGTVELGWPLWQCVLVAIVVSVIVALLVIRPLERLNGIYLAIASVSLVGLFQVLLLNLNDQTGGAVGINAIPFTVTLGGLLALVIAIAIAARAVERSGFGQRVGVMRADPLLARSMGVDTARVRLILFVTSAGVAALAGALRADYFGYVVPADYGFSLVITLLAMVIIGGVGSWAGPLVGAAIFTLLPDWLEPLGDWRDLVTGVLLLAIIIYSREGIVGAIRWQLINLGQRRFRRSTEGPGDPDAPVKSVGATE